LIFFKIFNRISIKIFKLLEIILRYRLKILCVSHSSDSSLGISSLKFTEPKRRGTGYDSSKSSLSEACVCSNSELF
jgi:hypothetical protein